MLALPTPPRMPPPTHTAKAARPWAPAGWWREPGSGKSSSPPPGHPCSLRVVTLTRSGVITQCCNIWVIFKLSLSYSILLPPPKIAKVTKTASVCLTEFQSFPFLYVKLAVLLNLFLTRNCTPENMVLPWLVKGPLRDSVGLPSANTRFDHGRGKVR